MSPRNERSTQSELDRVSQWLIRRAAHRTPESLSSRLEEEWLADLEYRSSALSRLGLALGCCWATLVIVSERSRNPAAAPVVAARGYISQADRNFGYVSLRSGTLFLILGLHASLFCGLVATLSQTRGLAAQPHLSNEVINPMSVEVNVIQRR